MYVPRNHCLSSERCKGCPVESLPRTEDRLMAGEIAVRAGKKMGVELDGTPNLVSIHLITEIAEEVADTFNRKDLTGPAVGALAMALSSYCRPEL